MACVAGEMDSDAEGADESGSSSEPSNKLRTRMVELDVRNVEGRAHR